MSWPSPAELAALANVGGWLFAAAILGIIIMGLIRGDLVPGWIYKRETVRADKATDMLGQITVALDGQSGVIDNLNGQIETLVRLLGARK